MAKIKNKLSYLLALLAPIFGINAQADEPNEPKSAGTEEEAVEAASGSLSAGAIAAAVAAAAAIAAASDGGSDSPPPAPTPAPTIIVTNTETVQQEVTKEVMVPISTETTTKEQVSTTTASAVMTETTILSRIATNSRSAANTVTLTQATASGALFDATLDENVANKTENDGVAELGEYYYVEIPTTVDSELIYDDVITTMTLDEDSNTKPWEYEIDVLTDVIVEVPVQTTNMEDVGIAVTSTAPAPE